MIEHIAGRAVARGTLTGLIGMTKTTGSDLRQMTLGEYVAVLPEDHLARRQYEMLRAGIQAMLDDPNTPRLILDAVRKLEVTHGES